MGGSTVVLCVPAGRLANGLARFGMVKTLWEWWINIFLYCIVCSATFVIFSLGCWRLPPWPRSWACRTTRWGHNIVMLLNVLQFLIGTTLCFSPTILHLRVILGVLRYLVGALHWSSPLSIAATFSVRFCDYWAHRHRIIGLTKYA